MYSLDPVVPHLERLLSAREFPRTICPSEAARALSRDEVKQAGAESWRDLMPSIRRHAFELRDQGTIDILQKGEILPSHQTLQETVGPIRLRRKP